VTLLFRPSRLRALTLRPALPLVLVSLAAALAFAFASSAQAQVVSVEGQQYGIQPHATLEDIFSFAPFSNLKYGGGPVMGTNATYAIYWDPAVQRVGDPGRPGKYHGDWQQLIDQFLYDIGANNGSLGNVFSLTPQYTEANGTRAAYSSTFRGPIVDRNEYPANGCTDPDEADNENFACFTDQQIRSELQNLIANNRLHAGLGTIFYVLTPPDVTICTDAGGITGHCSDSAKPNPWHVESLTPSLKEEEEEASYKNSFCSYHSVTATATPSEPLLYAVIPWVAGTYGTGREIRPHEPPKNGSDCQDGTGIEQQPNQVELAPDGAPDHGLPDLLINQIAAEQFATITDPTLNGWTEPLSGNEAPDQCRNWFEAPPVVQGSGSPDEHTGAGHYFNQTINGHSYYLNTEYNQSAQYYAYPGLRCELHNNFVPSFTAANPVNAGDIVGFNGAESDITLEQSAEPTPGAQSQYRATFSWNFGDGTPVVSGPGFSGPSASSPLYASVFHSYQYGGTYQATLTVTDAAGNVAAFSQTITVNGPPPPAPGPGGPTPNGPPTGGPGTSSGSGSGSGSGSTTGSVVPGPFATATAGNRSLSRALQKGLIINYSVNEQVAGHFEVLLDSATARRLGIQGRKAVGLPAGSPQSLIIGQAILVTTKGGHSSVRIKFSKRTSTRLRRVSKVTLLLRLVVRNAATQNPQSTTVLSPVVLHR
jgi:PKD domain-containing protein